MLFELRGTTCSNWSVCRARTSNLKRIRIIVGGICLCWSRTTACIGSRIKNCWRVWNASWTRIGSWPSRLYSCSLRTRRWSWDWVLLRGWSLNGKILLRLGLAWLSWRGRFGLILSGVKNYWKMSWWRSKLIRIKICKRSCPLLSGLLRRRGRLWTRCTRRIFFCPILATISPRRPSWPLRRGGWTQITLRAQYRLKLALWSTSSEVMWTLFLWRCCLWRSRSVRVFDRVRTWCSVLLKVLLNSVMLQKRRIIVLGTFLERILKVSLYANRWE